MWKPTVSSDEIWHHGILGQRYGKRNGPPYPLDAGEHSSKEKKEGWKQSLNAKDTKSRHKELARKYKDDRREAYERKKRKKASEKLRKHADKDAKRVSRSLERDKDYKAINDARDQDAQRYKDWAEKNKSKYSQSNKHKMTIDYHKQTKSDDKYKELSSLAEKHLRKKLGKKYDQKIVDPYGKETTRGALALQAYIERDKKRRQ